MKFVIAQIIGLVAMGLFILAFQQNSKKKILVVQSFSAGIFALHFILLGAFPGAGMNAMNIGRNYVLWKFDNSKWKPLWAFIVSLIFVTIGVVTWQNAWGLLAIIGQCLSCVTLSFKNPRTIRLFYVPVSVLWLIYNVVSLSIAGVLTESFNLVSLAVAIWRFEKKGDASA